MIINYMLTILISLTCAFCFFSALRIPVVLVLILCAMLIILCIFIARGKIKIQKGNIVYPLWILLSVGLLIYCDYNSTGVRIYNSMILFYMILGLLLVNYTDLLDVKRIIRIIVTFSCVLIGFIGLEIVLKSYAISPISFLFDKEALSSELMRIRLGAGFRGLAEFPNVISLASCILLYYAVFMLHDQFKKTIVVIISIVATMISGERSNIIFIPLVAFTVYYLSGDRNKIIRMLKIVTGIAVVLTTIYIFRGTLVKIYFFERVFNSTTLYFAGEDISSGRSRLYDTAISLWKTKPIAGNGWFYFYYNNKNILARNTYVHAHNIVLELLCDVGIIGTILFTAPIIGAIVQNVKALKNVQGAYKGILSFTLSIQLYFVVDSLLHVGLFSINMLPIYLICVNIFFVVSIQCKNIANASA